MHVTRENRNTIRKAFIEGAVDINSLSRSLKLQPTSIQFFLQEFSLIKDQYPEKLEDYSFYIGREKVTKETTRYKNLIDVLEMLVLDESGPVIYCAKIYRKYQLLYPNE